MKGTINEVEHASLQAPTDSVQYAVNLGGRQPSPRQGWYTPAGSPFSWGTRSLMEEEGPQLQKLRLAIEDKRLTS